MNDPNEEQYLKDLPLRSKEIGFSPDEMIKCKGCGKPNAPTRPSCLYCGAEIGAAGNARKFDLRPLESWQNGFNVVVIRVAAAHADRAAREISSVTSIDASHLEAIFKRGKQIPIARVESEAHAAFIAEKLVALGIESKTIPDSDLHTNLPPGRLRKIEFSEDDLVLTPFNNAEPVRVPAGELALIVVGTLLEGRVETVENRKRGSTKKMNEMQTSSDRAVVDIYSARDPIGWRITPHGFDFSVLGTDKAMLVADNMKRLIAAMQRQSPGAKLVTDFDKDRVMLEHCWPSESRRDALGLKRSGFAQKGETSVSTSSNAMQLLRYSRLQWHLL